MLMPSCCVPFHSTSVEKMIPMMVKKIELACGA
jgi:hypothetical protein